jgi:DNA-binding GntR family transcriptional regulator
MPNLVSSQPSPEDLSPRYLKASDVAYEAIYSKIQDGSLSPGSKLSLRKMAALAGVSVIPVIECLNRLVEDGLVETRPQWGYFVAMPTSLQVANQLVLREAVECQVARTLNSTLKAAEKNRLLRAGRRLDKLQSDFIKKGKGKERELEKNHYDFHIGLAEMTGFKSLTDVLRRIELFFILLKADAAGQRHPLPPNWHSQLAQQIAQGTPDEAEGAMRIHVQHSYKTILACAPKTAGISP